MRTLLLEPKRGWKIEELAKTARVSLGQASNVKKLLEDREWLQRSDSGIRLIQPSKLIQEWSESYSYRKNKAWDFYSMDEAPQIETKLATTCKDLAVKLCTCRFFSGIAVGAERSLPAGDGLRV